MTRTIVASATREVIIGFDQPFCVIGERINPTGRKKLAAEMIEGNFDTVIKDALEQVAAGATMLDVNAGVTSVNPNETEPGLLVQTMEIVQGLVDVPLSIDSSVTAAIEAALKIAKGRPLVNSVTGEDGEARGHPAAVQEVRRPGGRHLQRRDRHFRRSGRPLRRCQEDRRARRRLRHQAA
jgi:5-methyltetrahydrofolate--homocysteine methyltransferase